MTSLKDKEVSTRSMMDRLDETLKMLKHNFHNPLSTDEVRHHEESGKSKSFMEGGSDSSTVSDGGEKRVSGASVVGVVQPRGGGSGGGIYRFVSPMRYPLFSARYKFLHHYLFRCLVMFIFLVMVMGVFEWSIRRKMVLTGGSRNNRNDRQLVRTWKKFWIEMVWKALLVTVIINVILFMYLDLQTIP
jgi:hypothetical protein